MSPARVKKLKALATHPGTPEEERDSAIAMLKKHGVSITKSPRKKPNGVTTTQKRKRKTKKAKVPNSIAEQLIEPYSKNDPEWGWDAGFKGEGFKYIARDTKGRYSWAFTNKAEALVYAQTLV
jgi:hypothetical protein